MASSNKSLIGHPALNGRTVSYTVRTWHQKVCHQSSTKVMDVAIRTVNYVKKNGVNSRCFSALCDSKEAEHIQLLYHSEVRWLSRGLVLYRLFELRCEIQCFLSEKKSPLAHHYADVNFLAKLAYLADIFSQLNQLNLSIQEKNSNIFLVSDKI